MRKFVFIFSGLCGAAIVGVVVAVFAGRLASDKGQTVAAMLTVLVTLGFVVLTFESLQVLKQQVEIQKATICRFGLIKRNDGVYVWVANLGFSSFLVTSIHYSAQANSPLKESSHAHRTVAMGERKLFLVPESLYVHAAISREIAIQLEYVGPDGKEHVMKRDFLLVVSSDGRVVKIMKTETLQQAKPESEDS